MNSNLARARATMVDAQQRIAHGAIFGPAQFDRHNAAALTVDTITNAPARQRAARKDHMAGRHTTPTIGTCATCLDNYILGRD